MTLCDLLGQPPRDWHSAFLVFLRVPVPFWLFSDAHLGTCVVEIRVVSVCQFAMSEPGTQKRVDDEFLLFVGMVLQQLQLLFRVFLGGPFRVLRPVLLFDETLRAICV